MEERNKKLLVEKGLAIEMDPKIAEASMPPLRRAVSSHHFFSSFSLHLSVLQGSGVHLLKKDSKRRRTKAEILQQEQDKLAE